MSKKRKSPKKHKKKHKKQSTSAKRPQNKTVTSLPLVAETIPEPIETIQTEPKNTTEKKEPPVEQKSEKDSTVEKKVSEKQEESSTIAKKDEKPVTNKKRKNAILNSILVVCIAVLLFSVYKIATGSMEYSEGDTAYTDLVDSFLVTPIIITPPPSSPKPSPSPIVSDDVPPPENEAEESPEIYDNPAPDIWPEVDFEGLLAVNRDFAAWILLAGTNVNYPIVYSDDNQYYLNHLFDKRQNKLGTLFVDMRNKKDFKSRITIIYGHNMRNHAMFWAIAGYKKQSFYNEHQTIRLITPKGNYLLYPFSGYIADPETDNSWRVDFHSEEDYMSYVNEQLSRSMFVASGVTVTPEDKLVMLSTCSYERNNVRFVLYCKMVRTTEGVYIDLPDPTPEPTPEYYPTEPPPVVEEPPVEEFIPEITPEPEPTVPEWLDTNKYDDEIVEENPAFLETPEPYETFEPYATPEPYETFEPDATPEPYETFELDATPEPYETFEPDATPEPYETFEPDATPEPYETFVPEITPDLDDSYINPEDDIIIIAPEPTVPAWLDVN